MRVTVTGSSGFIGHHLVRHLKSKGHWVRGVDWKESEYSNEVDEFLLGDLRDKNIANRVMKDIDQVYGLAADMGGMGFIGDKSKQAEIFYNNSLINLNTIESARENKIKKYLYTSSACVYPLEKQQEIKAIPLKEEDAFPANPEDSYGWEKLFSEKLVQYYAQSNNMDVRIVRFHNIYGHEGTFKGGREKVPAALCRKVVEAKKNKLDYIEVWGDGKQTRTFCHIDDCIKGLELIMNGDYKEPINLGRSEMVNINQLAKIIMEVANYEVEIRHIEGQQGVRGRNSDNTLFNKLYSWEPEIDLKTGIKQTYEWIETKMSEE